MNDHLFTCNNGLRLITQFEGDPRLKARLCEGGAWELSYGVTFDLDGSPFKEGDTCTVDRAMTLFRNALERFEQAVRDMVTVPLTQSQFSALVAFTYNVGEANASGSTVIRMVNANRAYDAAASFGMWLYATKDGHKQALRGLLRRRYAEACLFLGYDWEVACADGAIALQREQPPVGIGTDRVIYKTSWDTVLRVAQGYPLPESPEPASAFQPAPAPIQPPEAKSSPVATGDSGTPGPTKDMTAPAEKPDAAGVAPIPPNPSVATPASVSKPEPAKPSNSSQAPVSAAGGAAATPLPQITQPLPKPPPVPALPPPNDALPADLADPKDMLLSRRFWGLFITGFSTLNFLPRGLQEWMGSQNNRELLSWLVLVIVGVVIFQIGKKRAKRPLK